MGRRGHARRRPTRAVAHSHQIVREMTRGHLTTYLGYRCDSITLLKTAIPHKASAGQGDRENARQPTSKPRKAAKMFAKQGPARRKRSSRAPSSAHSSPCPRCSCGVPEEAGDRAPEKSLVHPYRSAGCSESPKPQLPQTSARKCSARKEDPAARHRNDRSRGGQSRTPWLAAQREVLDIGPSIATGSSRRRRFRFS